MTKTIIFIREYRILLEKLIENKVRVADCPNIQSSDKKELQRKIDALIDKLVIYYHKSLDRSLDIISEDYYGRKKDY